MKKRACCIIAIAIIAGTALPRPAQAATTVSIGGNFYYTFWQPPWANGATRLVPHYFTFLKSLATMNAGTLMLFSRSATIRINDFKTIHGPMAGPSLSVNFANRWSISSVFLAGRFIASSTGPVVNGVSDKLFPYISLMGDSFIMFVSSNYRRDIVRYDSDTTAGCSLNRHVRLFAGFKYQGYQYQEKIRYITHKGGGLEGRGDAQFNSYGAGIGIGFHIPVISGLGVQINCSALCMYGTASYDFSRQFIFDLSGSLLPITSQFSDDRYWSAGSNATLSLAYHIEAANLTLSAGGRYQVLYYFWQADNRGGFLDYVGSFDHSYGATFSIIYSFSAGGGQS